MIQNRTVSVIITTYRRYDTIAAVCKAWLSQPVEQVWLLDGSTGAFPRLDPETVENPRFLYWPLPVDFQNRADYGIASLTDGDVIIFADDDLLPSSGFADKMVSDIHSLCHCGGMVGIIGRRFQGPNYRDNPHYRANGVTKPRQVSFVGVCYAATRDCAIFDTRFLKYGNDVTAKAFDDLYHCLYAYPDVPKWVAPNTHYRNLPSCEDDQCLFHTPAVRARREELYTKWWEETHG